MSLTTWGSHNDYGLTVEDILGGPRPGTAEHAQWRRRRNQRAQILAQETSDRLDENRSRRSSTISATESSASSASGPRLAFTQSKLMRGNAAGRNKANKALVGKSTMVVAGKTGLKKTKKVHVSSKFRKAVKQVISGTQAHGTYTTIKQGFVGSIMLSGGGPNSQTLSDLGNAANRAVCYGGTLNLQGSRTLFNCLVANNPGADATPITYTGLNFFTPAKILDAASVLFNNKQPGDPYTATGNLSEFFTQATGVPVTSKPTLKIDIQNSSVVFRMKNVSNRVVNVEIWECVPTIKFAVSNPLFQLVEMPAVFAGTADNAPIHYFAGVAGTKQREFYLEQGFDVMGVAKKFGGFPWKWKKRTMVLSPDETCIHSVAGPKGILDFRNLVNADTAGVPSIQLNCLLKNFSVGCIISVVGDQVLSPAVLSGTGGRSQFVSSTVGVEALGMPISVEIEEKYTIAVPEIAGFVTQAGAAGTTQMLNLRKHRWFYWNQGNTQSPSDTAATGYVVSFEENPTAESTAGVYTQ